MEPVGRRKVRGRGPGRGRRMVVKHEVEVPEAGQSQPQTMATEIKKIRMEKESTSQSSPERPPQSRSEQEAGQFLMPDAPPYKKRKSGSPVCVPCSLKQESTENPTSRSSRARELAKMGVYCVCEVEGGAERRNDNQQKTTDLDLRLKRFKQSIMLQKQASDEKYEEQLSTFMKLVLMMTQPKGRGRRYKREFEGFGEINLEAVTTQDNPQETKVTVEQALKKLYESIQLNEGEGLDEVEAVTGSSTSEDNQQQAKTSVVEALRGVYESIELQLEEDIRKIHVLHRSLSCT